MAEIPQSSQTDHITQCSPDLSKICSIQHKGGLIQHECQMLITRRYSPLRWISSRSCGGLRALAEAFYAVFAERDNGQTQSEQMEILMASKILIEHRNLLKFTAS